MFIAGNWKMNGTVRLARELAGALRSAPVEGVEVAVCPPYTALWAVAEALKGAPLRLGAQNMHWEDQGAFTGEVAPDMLLEAGVEYVIVGHSERRQYFAESDEGVAKKAVKALDKGLKPIVCVGETLAEREGGQTFAVLSRQAGAVLRAVPGGRAARVTLAYEPVWAIGTGRNAEPAQVEEAHAFLRGLLKSAWGVDEGAKVRIQYGGSVTAQNAERLFSVADVGGALVGGASLKAESFLGIIQAARTCSSRS